MTHDTAPDVAFEDAWLKSSYSSENGTNCVEVADLTPTGRVGIRDSKDKTGPALVIPAAAWASFVAEVRSGTWDHGLVD
ncbi:DUF397 domain-containing protein [Streptomyces sp. P1-3]|uniref:DUF397 domain-containing protein n=1 Tax=Streptomyces sp. P1-3 TaxID=3421658 RepID=UPI003D359D70